MDADVIEWSAGMVFGPVPGAVGVCEGMAQVFATGGFVHLVAQAAGTQFAIRMTPREAAVFAEDIATAATKAGDDAS
jgi:hypothetical protein